MSTRRARPRRPRLARGASPLLRVLTGLVVASGASALLWTPLFTLTLMASLVTGGYLLFLRDPERVLLGEGFVAAADGRIRAVEALADGRTLVSTYMRLCDVHVNRAPMTGTVTMIRHQSGGYRPAFRKESARNERMHWHFDTAVGEVEVVQIAGALVRRIVAYVPEGAALDRGERLGMIRLGSRVDVYLPSPFVPAVTVGDRVRAGVTRLDRSGASD